jgi:hypothetical protein
VKRFRSQVGPFEERLHFSTKEIDQMCVDALVQENLLPDSPQPIRIDRFIEKHFRCAVRYEDLGIGVMGCTVFNENGSVRQMIVSNRLEDGSKTSERRVRSTVAHEGGHGLMHASLFLASLDQGRLNIADSTVENLDFKARRILCRETDVREDAGRKRVYDGRWWEWQANRAIGGFLLPVGLVRRSLDPLLSESSVTRSPSLPSNRRREAELLVADTFDVNPIVAQIRLQEVFGGDGGQLEF